jgi:hypothetical protein
MIIDDHPGHATSPETALEVHKEVDHMGSRRVKDMSDPANRLDEAIADLAQFRRKWNSLGRPLTIVGSKGTQVTHPLIRMIRDSERAVQMLSRAPGAARGGRPTGSASAPDRTKRLKVMDLASARNKGGGQA